MLCQHGRGLQDEYTHVDNRPSHGRLDEDAQMELATGPASGAAGFQDFDKLVGQRAAAAADRAAANGGAVEAFKALARYSPGAPNQHTTGCFP